MIALGVGIDYALLILNRFRGERRARRGRARGDVNALDTAGRSVLFAGTTVVIALLGMLILGISFLNGPAIASALAVFCTMIGSLTLLPALLGLVRPAVKLGKLEPPDGDAARLRALGADHRAAPAASSRSATMLVLLVVAVPGARTCSSAPATPATTPPARRRASPTTSSPRASARASTARCSSSRSSRRAGDTAGLDEALDGAQPRRRASPPSAPPAAQPREGHRDDHRLPDDQAAGRRRRPICSTTCAATSCRPWRRRPASSASIGGATATTADLSERAGVEAAAVHPRRRRPLAAAARDRLPLARDPGEGGGHERAEHRRGARRDHVRLPGRPLRVAARRRTRRARSRRSCPCSCSRSSSGSRWTTRSSSSPACTRNGSTTRTRGRGRATGWRSTGSVIAAAAIIMISVFASFMLGDDRTIKLFGLGLASAVFFDAFFIRLILVPAMMFIFGKASWWMPARLERRMPRLSIEGPETPATEQRLAGLSRSSTPARRAPARGAIRRACGPRRSGSARRACGGSPGRPRPARTSPSGSPWPSRGPRRGRRARR